MVLKALTACLHLLFVSVNIGTNLACMLQTVAGI